LGITNKKFEIRALLLPKNVNIGTAGGQWKIVVILTLERLVISTSNLAQVLTTQGDNHPSCITQHDSQGPEVKAQGHNVT